MNAAVKQAMDADTSGLPELTLEELTKLEEQALGGKAAELAEDGLPDTFSEADLALLSEEERASMLEDEEFLVVTPTADPEPTAVVAAVVPASVAPDEPEPQIDLAAIDAKVQETIKDKRTEIMDAYDEGDMTRAEMEAALSTLISEAATIRSDLAQQERTAALTARQQQKVVEAWYGSVNSYHEKFPDLNSEAHINGWDKALKEVNSDPELLRLPADDRLRIAHENYAIRAAALGRPIPGPKGAAKPAVPPKEEKLEVKPSSERPPGPPTLAGFPASDSNEANDGRFATLDRLIETDPSAAEAAIARLSPAERDAYLRGA